jgi:hypothetical protein
MPETTEVGSHPEGGHFVRLETPNYHEAMKLILTE